jgi:hypothetical protein
MTVRLRIERLVISGLAPDCPALVLRENVERALSGLLSREAVEHLGRNPPARMPHISIGAVPPGRSMATHIALAIRDALISPAEASQ